MSRTRSAKAALPPTFDRLIGLWPSIGALANDCDVPYETAAAWKYRASIPHVWWELVAASAKRHGIGGVTYDSLKRMAAANRGGAPSLVGTLRTKASGVQDAQIHNRNRSELSAKGGVSHGRRAR
jgi:hypothetical protein